MNIKTYNAIALAGLAVFEGHDIGAAVAEPAGILVRSQNLHAETIPESVVAIGRAGAGVNNIPVDAMSERGIAVFNAPGANANAVKELVIGSLIAAYRNIPAAAQFVESLTTEGEVLDKEVEAGKKNFAGLEIQGKTLGVIGIGAVGGQVANAAESLGMRVIAYDPHATAAQRARLSPSIPVVDDISEVFAAADAITIHVPLLPETKGLIGEGAIARMKKGAVVLNFSRGGIVDDTAILAAIAEGTVSRYVCDFPTAQLRGQKGVIALPHLGASTEEAEEQSAVMAAKQMKDYIEHGTIVNAVNLPRITLERQGVARIAIIHRNEPDMLGQITHVLGERGVNIEAAANAARGAYACTLLDVGTQPTPDALTALRAVPHVIRVRTL